jgi:hypothetical protein
MRAQMPRGEEIAIRSIADQDHLLVRSLEWQTIVQRTLRMSMTHGFAGSD